MRARDRIGCVLLIMAGLVCGLHAQTPPDASPRPIKALAWSASKERTFDHIVPFMFIRGSATPQQAKQFTDKQPVGYRTLMWDRYGGDPLKHPDDLIPAADGSMVRGIWFDHGEAQTTEAVGRFFSEYKQLGGELDYLVLDYETGLSVWALANESFAAIEAHPRFAQEDWQQQLGFADLPNWLVKQRYRTPHMKAWNTLMVSRVAEMINRAVYGPVTEVYPNVKASNYGHFYNNGDVPNMIGHAHIRPATALNHVGNHQARDTYGRITPAFEKKALDGKQPLGKTPFKGFLVAVNDVRNMLRSSDVPIQPWIGFRSFSADVVPAGNTDYYQEIVIHAALYTPDVLLYWNPRPWKASQNPNQWCDDAQDELVNRILTQVNQLIGYDNRQIVSTELAQWSAPFVVTGVTVNDKTFWRFTPDLEATEEASAQQTLVQANPLTFEVKGKRISFPRGQMIEFDDQVSKFGIWIETPANVRPTVR